MQKAEGDESGKWKLETGNSKIETGMSGTRDGDPEFGIPSKSGSQFPISNF
jgi:hypothetical protein